MHYVMIYTWQHFQTMYNLLALLLHREMVVTNHECKHDQCYKLASVCLLKEKCSCKSLHRRDKTHTPNSIVKSDIVVGFIHCIWEELDIKYMKQMTHSLAITFDTNWAHKVILFKSLVLPMVN